MKKYITLSLISAFVLALVGALSFSAVSAKEFTDANGGKKVGEFRCFVHTRDLHMGSRDGSDNDVSELQSFLQMKGYLTASSSGYFGPLTVKALAQFQKDNNISALGVFGPITRNKIRSIRCNDGTAVSATPVVSSLSPSSGKVGDTVTISGNNFTSTSTVYFGGSSVNKVSNSATSIAFVVPEYITPCKQGMICPMLARLVSPGTYKVSVSNGNKDSNEVNFTVVASSTTAVNSTFILSLGESKNVTNTFSVKAVSVAEDSRCPLGVMCIQAGSIVVQTLVTSNGATSTQNLSLGSNNHPTVVIDGYTVTLVGVTPIKRQNDTIQPREYRITYQVVK